MIDTKTTPRRIGDNGEDLPVGYVKKPKNVVTVRIKNRGPNPRIIGARRLWDRDALTLAFRDLPEDRAPNALDIALSGAARAM